MPVDGEEVPLLSGQMVRNRRGGGYRMYAVCAKMGIDVLLRAVGRPYEPAEAKFIKPALRRTWFNHYLLEAEGDQRWS